MKNMKKLVMAVTALTMCATSAFAFSACKDDDKHEHTYTWSTTTPPTCDTDGLETGICEEDGDITTRPIDKLGHNYGEWQITKPTATKDGSAKKVCKNDGGHTINVTLPKFGDDNKGYKVEAVSGSEVVKKYTYTDATHGDISFTTANINSVAVAVKAGTEFNKNVVSGTVDLNAVTARSINSDPATPDGPIEVLVDGENGEKEVWLVPQLTNPEDYTTVGEKVGVIDDTLTEVFKGSASEPYFQIGAHSEIIYEFGDKYLHLKNDAEKTEGFYNFDENGKLIFPVSTMYVTREDGDKKLVIKDEGATDEYADGFGFGFTYYNVDEGVKFYGLGAFVTKLYECGKLNPNSDFAEAITEEDGKTYYTFSFGEYLNAFNKISVKFTLNDEYVIDWAELECKSYKTTDWDPSTNTATPNVTVSKDGETYSVAKGHEDHWKEYECFTLTQKTSFGDAAVPSNPYKLEDMLISSYDWESSGATVDENDANKLTANPTKAVTLQFKNIAPETFNPYFDGVKVYERIYSEEGSQTDGKGNKYDDVELKNDYEGADDGHIKANFHREDNYVTLTSYSAGTHTLVLKTENTEKIITLDVPYAAPSVLLPDVYSYDEVKEEGLWLHSSTTAQATVYAGQTLYFNSYVEHSAYQSAEFTADATVGATLGTAKVEGKDVSTFVAENVGAYTITLTSKLDAKRVCTIEVTVKEAPDVSAILNGVYMNIDNEEETVAFASNAETPLSGEATLNVSLGKTKLENVKFNYSYDTTKKEFTLTNVPAAQSGLELGLELSPSYKLFLTYKDEFGNTKKIYLVDEIPNILVGNYILAADQESATALTANITGDYTLALPDWTMYSYQIGDETVVNGFAMGPVTIGLAKGDTFKIWSTGSAGQTYGISYTEVTPFTSISIDKTTAKISPNDSLSLTVTTGPDGATGTQIGYIVSDSDLVTINPGYAPGTFTVYPVYNSEKEAYNEGTVKITFVSRYDHSIKAECTLTIESVHVTSVTLDKTSAEMTLGSNEPLYLNATIAPADATDQSLIWTSSDDSVVSVSYGYVYANGVGTAKITCSSQSNPEAKAECTITVVKVDATGVTLDKTNEKVYLGNGKLTLTATVAPADASNKNVTWESSDTTIATVEGGVVTFLKEGNVTITCKSEDNESLTATCAIEVKTNAVSTVSIPASLNAYVNSTATLEPTFTGAVEGKEVSDKTVTWTSSDTTVATVDENGIITTLKAGTATITVTTKDGNKQATCTLTVAEAPTLGLGDSNTLSLHKEQTAKLAFSGGEANTTYEITVSFDKSNVLGLSVNGSYIENNSIVATFTTDSEGNATVMFKTSSRYDETLTVTANIAVYVEKGDITLGTKYFTNDQEPESSMNLVFIGEAGKTYNVTINSEWGGMGIDSYTIVGADTLSEEYLWDGTYEEYTVENVVADENGKIVISTLCGNSILITEA